MFLAYFNCFEGFDSLPLDGYKEYDLNNPSYPLILSQQNAGNISALKTKVDELTSANKKLAIIDKEVRDISLNVATMNTQMEQIAKQQASAATSLVGNVPPKITGAN
jgi:hypothetical protein